VKRKKLRSNNRVVAIRKLENKERNQGIRKEKDKE
jgi:hypothetical protein